MPLLNLPINQVNVLLIESGGSGSHITDIPQLNGVLLAYTNMSRTIYTTVQHNGVCNGQPCALSAARFLGGGSTHNGLLYVRGSRQDFTEWTELGLKGWSYKDVLPYMIELETYRVKGHRLRDRGVEGPIKVSSKCIPPYDLIAQPWKDSATEKGYKIGDYNGPRQTYFGDAQSNVGHGVRQSTDNAYLRPFMGKRSNLHVIMFSHVTRVLFNDRTAIGVEYVRNGTLHQVMASSEVILSAGALATPQILMLSGIGPKKELAKFNIKPVAIVPGVGRNLQDHLRVFTTLSTNLKYPNNTGITKENYELWRTKKRGILASAGGCSIGFITTNNSVNSNDSQLRLVPSIDQDDKYPEKAVISAFVASTRIYSRGYVKLQSTNPFDDMIVNPRYLSHGPDKENLISGLKVLYELFNSEPFKDANPKVLIDRKCSKQFVPYSDDWLYCTIQMNSGTCYHYSCTCKMGPTSDPMAVVNDQLQVRKVKNLRVIDASVMPQVTRGNTNAPVMMIGLKGADMIRKRWRV